MQIYNNLKIGIIMKAKTKPIKVDWDVDDENDLFDLPLVVDVPANLFDDEEDEDAVSDYLSDEYCFCVNGWCELTDKEEIAYNCTKNILSYGDLAKDAKKIMEERQTPLEWANDLLYNAIKMEINNYCKHSRLNSKDYDVNDIFELTFNFI